MIEIKLHQHNPGIRKKALRKSMECNGRSEYVELAAIESVTIANQGTTDDSKHYSVQWNAIDF